MNVGTVVRELREDLADGGLSGAFLVRDLRSGEEIGIDPDVVYPTSSLVKVPLAIATLCRIEAGELDGATPIDVLPGDGPTLGPHGVSQFRHPARIALDDLLYLSVAISDNAAAEAVFALTPPSEVAGWLQRLGIAGISVRHTIHDLVETPAELFDRRDVHLAHTLAIGSATEGHGHPVPQLDVTIANAGSARAFVDLLEVLWRPVVGGAGSAGAASAGAGSAGAASTGGAELSSGVAARVRQLMASNMVRWRLAPDFSSDSSTWSSKTGTLLNLRHEVGVVEHADGGVFAVAALTESRVAAAIQPGADALMAHVARSLRDHLRRA